MNWRWCNNEIICTVLWINQRYFSSKKDSVEIFNTYMQKVNLKSYNFSFILLMFLFRAWCMQRKFQLQGLWSCALVWWCQNHHLPSHTHIILSHHFTNNFSVHTTIYSHVTLSWTENDLHSLSFVPVYQHVLYFPTCFSWWEIENFYIVFPYTIKERVKQGYFSGCLKMHKMLLPKQIMVSLDAPAPSLSLSQTSSDIWFGDRNPALLRTYIADRWLTS
jgi:hypothetical protein